MSSVAAHTEPPTTQLDAQVGVDTAPHSPDPTHERVAMSLRGARARTGLSEQHVVTMLNKQGVAISLGLLRRAERTGTIDLALAVQLADAYGTTTDCLAGRRLNNRQVAPPLFAL